MATLLERITWERCSCCGGYLPCVDGDNGSTLLPKSRTGGSCPGHVTQKGHCGAYSDTAIADWLATADDDAEGDE